jgi:mono/diheme cytochrome c family protein
MRKAFTVLGGFAALVLACGGGGSGGMADDPRGRGARIYHMHCTLCHGQDGDLGINGAKDLRASALTRSEVAAIVREGRGLMAAYKHVLNKAEIDAVTDHVMGLRKPQ